MDKNKMLIDATHPEETRVVVLRNGRVEEFDFESASRKLLRGNIYLAKVTRVEPSLQAAFVEYGGNRHGFLAFNEIHPDYYQIPIADRELLKQEEAEAEAAAEAEADERARQRDRRRRRGGDRPSHAATGDNGNEFQPGIDDHAGSGQPYVEDVRQSGGVDSDLTSDGDQRRDQTHADDKHPNQALAHDHLSSEDRLHEQARGHSADHDHHGHSGHDGLQSRSTGDRDYLSEESPGARGNYAHDNIEEIEALDGDANGENGGEDQVEQIASGDDALEELPERPRRRARQYKIQEVIKRRQIILIQVVKEERGNKGAALTTYISLAGRYTVLMPNTGRGGGISRKITQPQDRKRLKAIAEELEVSEGMGLIIRTAGAAQSKQEIKRDYEYLLRLWENVRELTLSSTAPCLVYEEGNLIKRSIRDLYSKDIDDIQVAGDAAYREASDFMGMLMPGHADAVTRYESSEPLFTRFGIERQLAAMFNPVVTLRSGGYIVINQTEALVAVDVNSGKSTREFSIEETALNTNNEAAEEIARQLKLRDLAGLIVVDFIDMEEKRNNRTVERRMKDALRHDRARIQVGRISHFGLLEMSRQRLRTGAVEGSTSQCPHCQGTGTIRSTESVALVVLRAIEDHMNKQPSSISVSTNAGVALYILNNKRTFITEMERRFGIVITVEASDRMQGANFAIERTAGPVAEHVKPVARAAVSMDWGFDAGEADNADSIDVEHAPARDDADEGHRSRGSRDDSRDRPRNDRGDRTDRTDIVRDRDGEREGRRDEVQAEGEDGGRTRRKRRRRGRRDREAGDDRGHQGHDGNSQHNRLPEPDEAPGNGAVARSSGGDAERTLDRDRQSSAERRDSAQVAAPVDHEPADAENAAAEAVRDRVVEHRDPQGHDDGPTDARSDDESRQKRGRRRGRRGGRSRGGSEHGVIRNDDAAEASNGDAQPSENWRQHDVARPGASQPGGEMQQGNATATEPVHDLVATDYRSPDVRQNEIAAASRPAIPETAAAAHQASDHAGRVVEHHPAPAVSIVAVDPAPAQVTEAPHRSLIGTVPEQHAPQPSEIVEDPSRPIRKGWWQRRFGSD